ncbi:hypothetical protein [Endozoicomonas sp. SESOKO1]|uniref:hypothetical protein n=1 Tax=Endozoicomonas sp. SESOKO1 TaxID=2828742 RepID=UPI0021479967|nr:hypothetical protein [Endozoicomonas sp. SESOKO1]
MNIKHRAINILTGFVVTPILLVMIVIGIEELGSSYFNDVEAAFYIISMIMVSQSTAGISYLLGIGYKSWHRSQ